MTITCAEQSVFALRLRLPWWLAGEASVTVNGTPVAVDSGPSSFVEIQRTWQDDQVRIELPKRLTVSPLPDRPQTVAFMDGPVVLAGLCDDERRLVGKEEALTSLLVADNEREWTMWQSGYRTINQEENIRFVPLHEISDERYTVYFPLHA